MDGAGSAPICGRGKPAFEEVTLAEADQERVRNWQDDGLMVDYVLRNGQVDCVLRRQIWADDKLWELTMTAPLAGNTLPEDRMTAREREMCREDMNHDFLSGVFNRRYAETELCTKLDEWADAHRCASLRWSRSTTPVEMFRTQGEAVMDQVVCFVANQWKKHYDPPGGTGGSPDGRRPVPDRLCRQDGRGTGHRAAGDLQGDAAGVYRLGGG